MSADASVRETARLISSDKVEGTSVRRSDGDKIGTIEHVMIDKRSGRVAYAAMSFGGFLGLGSEYRALPWSALRYNERLDAYELNVSDDELKNAPVVSADFSTQALLNAGGRTTSIGITGQRRIGDRVDGAAFRPLFFSSADRTRKMKSKLVAQNGGERTFVLVLDPGDDAFAAISRFAGKKQLSAASLTAIGAFSKATVGWFDLAAKTYRKIPVNQQCEVLSALGDIALDDKGKPSLHMHVVLGLSDGTTRGGHLLTGSVQPTLEVTLVEAPAHLRRRQRPEFGLALIDLTAAG